MKKITIKKMLIAVMGVVSAMTVPIMGKAEETAVGMLCNVYEFSKNDAYVFENLAPSDIKANTKVYISGDIVADGDRNGVPAYAVGGDEAVSFGYSIESALLTDVQSEWHLEEDKGKKVNDITLEESIQKGAVILQISNDGEKWVSANKSVNVFAEGGEASFYETTDLELLNGCYYRIIVAYELSRQLEDSQILFVKKENYDYQKYAEVYEFYLYDKDDYIGSSLDDVEKIKLGKRIKTEDEGYTGQIDIDKDDPHYGWELGEFFVSGFTSKNTIDGTQYVLKNVGDVVTLGFYLNQDIDKLNDKDTLSISCDKDGYDKAFEIAPTNFGRGTLIIQYTNPDGVTGEPQIYTNYLEANLSPKANTAVRLCEEGDYKVALDYEIQNDNKMAFGKSILPKKTHYRIAFNFSVRNSNCMVYTFDNVTGSELRNGNITNNGFYIDLANSQYLDVSVKKEVLEDGADGLTEDTRFNRKARDKEVYEDDGIYTITVKNKAAELESEKKIYVGTNRILKAYMVTGLSIAELQDKVAQGATIADDGTVIEPSGNEIKNTDIIETETTEITAHDEEKDVKDVLGEAEAVPDKKFNKTIDFGIIAAVIVVVLVVFWMAVRGKKKKTEGKVQKKGSSSENTANKEGVDK